MIDVFAELYTIGRNAVIEEYPNAEVSSTQTLKPTHFPYTSIIEGDNSVYSPTRDSARMENHAQIMLEVQVYTTGDSKQTDCRAIIGVIDRVYGNIGLQRIMMSPVTNYNDTTKYRMVARYTGIISRNKEIYRR